MRQGEWCDFNNSGSPLQMVIYSPFGGSFRRCQLYIYWDALCEFSAQPKAARPRSNRVRSFSSCYVPPPKKCHKHRDLLYVNLVSFQIPCNEMHRTTINILPTSTRNRNPIKGFTNLEEERERETLIVTQRGNINHHQLFSSADSITISTQFNISYTSINHS